MSQCQEMQKKIGVAEDVSCNEPMIMDYGLSG